MCDYVRARHFRSPLRSEVSRQGLHPPLPAVRIDHNLLPRSSARDSAGDGIYPFSTTPSISFTEIPPAAERALCKFTADGDQGIRPASGSRESINVISRLCPRNSTAASVASLACATTTISLMSSTAEDRCRSLVDHVSRSLPSARL